jgi:hypothetical protein
MEQISADRVGMLRRQRGVSMSRVAMAISAGLVAALLMQSAAAQSNAHSFSGLCAYYSGRGGGLTAAHRTLPFGTRVRVTDPKNGRSVIVRINDRGPFGRHRVLDLSTSAARALGMIDRGVIYVTAEVL